VRQSKRTFEATSETFLRWAPSSPRGGDAVGPVASRGRRLQAANREAPGFKPVYAQLSNFAHPSYAGTNTSMTVTNDNHFAWRSQQSFKSDDEASVMYLWLLELTEVAGPLWCRRFDAVSGGPTG
jgi:hypothetical protein